MSKTNIALAEHAKKALKEKWFYGWGSYGQKATTELINQLVRQYPENARWKTYMTGAVTAGTRLCDCYGLVKSYLWWTDDKGDPKYNSAQDKNTLMAYNAAKEKGVLSTLPETEGIVLYMNGHVGVYCGNGKFIELMGGGVGAYEGKITNKVITKGSKFTHWFKDINIIYTDEKTEPCEGGREEAELVDTTNLKVNGKIYNVNRILKDGSNFIKLSDLGNCGFVIGYDENIKLPELLTPDKIETTPTELIIDGNKYVVDRILKDGNNYVKLQDFKEAGFDISYNVEDKVPVVATPKNNNLE